MNNEKLACNISPAWRKVAPTFEDILSEKQEPIPGALTLDQLADEFFGYGPCGKKD